MGVRIFYGWKSLCLVLLYITGNTVRADNWQIKIPDIIYNFPREYLLTLEAETKPITDTESLHFKFKTRGNIQNASLIHGRTSEHLFKVELADGRLVFRFADDSGLAISSYSQSSKEVNDDEWHRLKITRVGSQFKMYVDDDQHTEVPFRKNLTENVFAGSRITLGFNYGTDDVDKFYGDIAEIMILLSSTPLQLKENPVAFSDLYPSIHSYNIDDVDKVVVRMDMASGHSVAFMPNDPEIEIKYPVEKDFDSFGVTFKTASDGIIASLLGDDSFFIGLEVFEGELRIVVEDPKYHVSVYNLGSIEFNEEHTVHLRNDRQGDNGLINAWLTNQRAFAKTANATNPFLINKIIVGGKQGHRLFKNAYGIVGCVTKPYLNLFTLNLGSSDPRTRSNCSTVFKKSLTVNDHVGTIAFRPTDRPLPFTYAQNDKKIFHSLELKFSTLEESGIIASLHNSSDNFIGLYFQNGSLYLTIDDIKIVHNSFPVCNKKINDGVYHTVRIVNEKSGPDYAEVDGIVTLFPIDLSENLWVTTIYFGAVDNWAKDHYRLNNGENFIGCLKDILFNGEHLIRYDHIADKTRINSKCQPKIRPKLPTIVHLRPEVKFACTDLKDVVWIKLSDSEEFTTLTITMSTLSNEGAIASLSSLIDKRYIILYIKRGSLNLAYSDHTGKEAHLITDGVINDGKEYHIALTREPLGILVLKIGRVIYNVPLPSRGTPLFFDMLVIGGAHHSVSSSYRNGQYQGCFQNVKYNRGSVIPMNTISSSRHECKIIGGRVCDVRNPCTLGPTYDFCSSKQCSLRCQSSDFSYVKYKYPVAPAQTQLLSFLFRTNAINAVLYSAISHGQVVSVVIEGKVCVLKIKTAERIHTLDFPPRRVSDGGFHHLMVTKYLKKLNLSLDGDEIVHDVSKISQPVNLFGIEMTLCSHNYNGYLQDVFASSDDVSINILDTVVQQPHLASYIGNMTIWENKYSNHKRDVKQPALCSELICPNGKKCRLKRNSQSQLCICYSGSEVDNQCALPDLCAQVLCVHGHCRKQNGRAYCECNPGYTGTTCEQPIDICLSVSCNYGTCYPQTDNPRGYICQCMEGYKGDDCNEADPCYGIHCQNRGHCYLGQCICPPDFTGKFCEADVSKDPCQSIICQHGGYCSNGRCICPQSYTGAYCETKDPCAGVNCLNNGYCANGRCVCPQGYYGHYCEQSDPCANINCANGGRCENGRCICVPGYFGYYCEQVDHCARITCHNGGRCENGQCICTPGYSGPYCTHADLCYGINCVNGQCKDGACVCHPGYTGKYCENKDLCYGVNCVNGACVEGRCQCNAGFQGEFCDQQDLCASVVCQNGGICDQGKCLCPPSYTGAYCEDQIAIIAPPDYGTHTQGLEGLKGGLIEYGRHPRFRSKHLGAILGIITGFILGALAAAYGVRKCAEGACAPGRGAIAGTKIPVVTGESKLAQTEAVASMIGHTVPTEYRALYEHSAAEDRQKLLSGFDAGLGGVGAGKGQSEKIETIHERIVEREYMDQNGVPYIHQQIGHVPISTTVGPASYGYGDFGREQMSQSQFAERVVESDVYDGAPHAFGQIYHAPPIADFGYGIPPRTEAYRFSEGESWEIPGSTLQMNSLPPPVTTEYELSNINTLAMTPNGKYAIVGQSQGPPQIWDAQNGNLISSMYGTCNNCTQLALACNGSLLVGLASDVVDTQPCIIQIWDVNTGRPIHLSHQIKCSTFTLSNNTNNLVMAGNQKYGRGISVGILDLVSNELTKEVKSETHMSFGKDPSFIALTPDERNAIIGCFNQAQGLTNYVVFDLTTNSEIIQPPHISLDSDPRCCVVLNNREVITGLTNGQLLSWDTKTCKPLHYFSDANLDKTAHRGKINDIKLSPDKSLMITASNDCTAKIWDTSTRELVTRLMGQRAEVTCGCISSNQLATTGSRDHTICLWRVPSGQLAAQMNIGMVPVEVHMAAQNRTVVAIGEKDDERQLLMLRVVSMHR